MNDVHDDASAYALDALTDEERALFERHLADCAGCRREVASFREALAGLDDSAPPPRALRDRVLDEVAATPQEPARSEDPRSAPAPASPPTDLSERRASGWSRRLAGAAAAIVLLVTGGIIGAAVAGGGGEPALDDPPAWLAGAEVVPLEAPEGARARFLYSPDDDRGVLVAEGLPALDSDEATYALWVLRGTTPEPAGLFRPDDAGAVVAEATSSLEGADAVAVTVEPPGGSPAPTSEILVQGVLR